VESDSSQASSKSQNKCLGQIVSCDLQELRPHPSYARHGLSVSACKLASLRARGEQAFLEHLPITRDRIIIDGYAHWELAKELKRPLLADVAEREFLLFLYIKKRSEPWPIASLPGRVGA
jgi:hypothetical protein